MRCERFHEAIASHAAGAVLDPATAAHLSACDICAARLDDQRRLLADVDAELERALAVVASPELVTRVTARAGASRPRPTTWRPAVAWTALTAAAALATAVYVREPRPEASVQPTRSVSAPAATPAVAPRPAAGHPIASTARRVTGHRPMSRAPSQAVTPPGEEPPVIVDGSQLQAIARLQELLASGRLNEKTLPSPRPHATAELTISPIHVADITVPDVDAPGRAPETGPR
jgi:hypothetical protein